MAKDNNGSGKIEKGGYQPLNEGYSPKQRGYVPNGQGGNLPKAPTGGTGESPAPVAPAPSSKSTAE